jgi:hypothetical protein
MTEIIEVEKGEHEHEKNICIQKKTILKLLLPLFVPNGSKLQQNIICFKACVSSVVFQKLKIFIWHRHYLLLFS